MSVILEVAKLIGFVPAPMVDSASNPMRGRALLEANKLGVFRALEGGPLSVADVAASTGTSEIGMEALLAALAASGYLTVRNGRYGNGRWVTRWILDSGGGLTHYLDVQLNVWDRASTLGDCVKAGKPVADPHAEVMLRDGREAEIYVRGMEAASRLIIPHFVPKIHIPDGATRMLDLGGSHGNFSRALIDRHPGLRSTVLDLPGPAAAAQRLARDTKVTFRGGNFLEDDLGEGWDVVLLISTLHVFHPEQSKRLVGRVARALRPGGTFVILDHLRGVSRVRDRMVTMLGLNWLTTGGRTYTLPEVQSLLSEAGFSRTKVSPLATRIGATVVQATR